MAKQASQGNARPTMGTSAATSVGALPVIKGRSVKKTNQSKGGFLEAATATHRANVAERLGPTFVPTSTLYQANAAEASDELRATRLVPSAAGYQDFRAARAAAGSY
jgi:hypothetical protein